MARWAVLITNPDGGQEYVCTGVSSDKVAVFTTRLAARETLDGLLMGLDGGTRGEVVPAPKGSR